MTQSRGNESLVSLWLVNRIDWDRVLKVKNLCMSVKSEAQPAKYLDALVFRTPFLVITTFSAHLGHLAVKIQVDISNYKKNVLLQSVSWQAGIFMEM